jgi:hypothetical protein
MPQQQIAAATTAARVLVFVPPSLPPVSGSHVVIQRELARLSGQGRTSMWRAVNTLGLNPLPAFAKTRGSDGGRTSFRSCGSAQRGIRIHLQVNDPAESDTIKIGSAISGSTH